MRVLFMGTPTFAVPTLRALAAHAAPGRLWASGLDLIGVVTRPDKPSGRGKALASSPVKLAAEEMGLPVHQPGPLRRPEALALLHHLAPDVIVVAAFGQILPPQWIDDPEHGCLNVHASLLPRHRGASPVAAAILEGDQETGVSIMLMDPGLDTGHVLGQRRTPIGERETAGQLGARLAQLGAGQLIEVLPLWLAGGLVPAPQDERRATMTRLLRKEDGRLDWTLPAPLLDRRIRAFTPWPGAQTAWEGRRLKVLQARPLVPDAGPGARAPGEVFAVPGAAPDGRLAVACGQGALELEVIQLEGKRALPASEFMRGQAAIVGARLESPPPPTSAAPPDLPAGPPPA